MNSLIIYLHQLQSSIALIMMPSRLIKIEIFILLMVIVGVSEGFGQKIFKPDKTTNQLTDQVPFDQYFYVDIDDPEKAIETFEVWRLYKVDGVVQDCKNKPEDCDKTSAKFGKRLEPSSSNDELIVLQLDKISRLVVPPLDPNKHFELLVINKFRGEALQKFIDNVLDSFFENEDKGITALIKLGKEIQPNAPGIIQTPRTILGRDWYENQVNGNSDFKTEAKKFLRSCKVAYDSALNPTNYAEITVSNLTSQSYSKAERVYAELDKSFTLFAEFNAIEINSNLFQGLTSPAQESIDTSDFIQRAKYLANSKKKLNELIDALQRVRTHDVGNDDTYVKMITDARSVLDSVKVNLTFLNRQISKVMRLLDDESNMRYYTWVGGTNVVTNLETMSKRYIIPTIGLAYIATEDRDINFLKPFAGVSFHLRAIDKEVPLSELSDNLLHRTTIFLGFTATKLNDETKKYSDQNETFSLMAGVNFKLTHAIGISAGGIALKRVNPNPTITIKQKVISPYLSLTLDVDFAKQLSKLTSKGNL